MLLLNKQLKPFQFELCKARLEDDEQHWYAVVNRAPDAAAKIGSKFSAQELEFFNKAVCISVLDYLKDSQSKDKRSQMLFDL